MIILRIIIASMLLLPLPAWGQKVLKVGVLRAHPPFSFIDQHRNVLRGFSVDIAKLLAADMGQRIEFYAMQREKLLTALTTGRIDLISGLMVRSGSIPDINLIETGIQVNRKYFVNNDCLTLTCYKDLPGHSIALEHWRNLTEFQPFADNATFIRTESQEKALSLLNTGTAQVYISDCSIASLYFIQKNGFHNIKEIGMPIETVPLSLAVRSANTELLTELSVAFGKILENKSYDTIYNKWLGRDIRFLEWSRYLKFVLAAVGLTAAALLSFIFWNLMLKRKVAHITDDLKRSEQKYRDLIESSPDMIHLISPDGTICLANKIALQHLGYTEEEIVFFRLNDLVSDEQQADMASFVETVFRDGYSNKEFVFQSKTGDKLHVEMVATVVRGPGNAADLACCFSRDLTERKRLEEDLIHSDRLAIMGQMAAGLAHEINNPLGIILTNAEDVLYHELEPDDSLESLKSIERNALRAAKIIEDLLTFTRPAPPEVVPIDLPQLIDSSLLFLKQKLKQKRIRIEKSYPADPIRFNGDENLIQQLLINLILNAVQAIRNEGCIRIRVDGCQPPDESRISITVEDNGIGIPVNDLKKIFDPFFTSRKEKGFGLGLFTSRIIIEKHHGTIRARSKRGQGTTITVEFPLTLYKQPGKEFNSTIS